MNALWLALAREASLAAQHIAIGATALGRANYAAPAYYSQAFFSLSIGFERSSKLIFVVDHALDNAGAFPSHAQLRAYGHDLRRLLDLADAIAARRVAPPAERLPRDSIHEGIVDVLGDFATNITRYYNLDLVTGSPSAALQTDPLRAWHENVTARALAVHYTSHRAAMIQERAAAVAAMLGDNARAYHHAETGEVIESIFDASVRTGQARFIQPYCRMYVLQIARFLAFTISNLTSATYETRLETIPHLTDFYGLFMNPDTYLRSRATWSIHRP